MESVPSTATTATVVTIGRFMTPRTQRRPMVGRVEATGCALFQAREPSFGASFAPARPSIAGTRVTAAAMAMKTATAAPTPMTERKGMPTTSSPSRAMITVTPAKTTALPAVPTAIAADSSGSSPRASWPRCRDRMKRA